MNNKRTMPPSKTIKRRKVSTNSKSFLKPNHPKSCCVACKRISRGIYTPCSHFKG